jgi:putative tricarboxylic transport membrane protein
MRPTVERSGDDEIPPGPPALHGRSASGDDVAPSASPPPPPWSARWPDLAAGVVVLVIGLLVVRAASDLRPSSGGIRLGPGPDLFPLWLGRILVVLAVLYLVQTLRAAPAAREAIGRGPVLQIGLTVLTSATYLYLIPRTGFGWATFLYLAVELLRTRAAPWWACLLVAAAITVAVDEIFVGFLDVRLP